MRAIITALISLSIILCACSRKTAVKEESASTVSEMVSISDTTIFRSASYDTINSKEVNRISVTIQEDYDNAGVIRHRTIMADSFSRKNQGMSHRDFVYNNKIRLQTSESVASKEMYKEEKRPSDKVKSFESSVIYIILLLLIAVCLIYTYKQYSKKE